jgi:hypothetical protein
VPVPRLGGFFTMASTMMFQIEALRHQVAQAESEKVSAIRGSGVVLSSQI